MSDSTKRRLDALQRLAERPGTPAEGEAAEAAIARISSQRASVEPPQPSSNAAIPDALVGLKLQLDRTVDRLRRCCPVGCVATVVLDGADPHTYTLRCAACYRDLGALHHSVSDHLRRWLDTGRILSCPVLKDNVLRL